MEQIVVGMADCRIGDNPAQVLATYALGSCIGLALHDAAAGVGGLLHFMLPDSGIDRDRSRQNPWMFADTGIPMLLDRLCARGASKRRLTVRAAGGASMMDKENIFDIGRRNYLAMRKILWKAGVMVHGEAVGGVRSRTVRLEIGSGKFLIQEGGEVRELAAGFPQMGGM
ncbi:MAG TPA: chemotaxis protein CheD [Bryobacteraceae bacterium]|nr:chemotaxis protein CheD [Bryobacteraceae bacterium]